MILNGRVINPGELRTPVLLAPRTVSVETGGFQCPGPDADQAVSAWARWQNVHGAETWTAAAQGAVESATVLIRYRSDLDATWYISKDGGVIWFEIVGAPDDIEERHEYLECKVKRYRSG